MPAGSITLGIRPENWTLSASENGVINGVIERVENLGDHRLIQTSIDDLNIFIKTTRSDIKEKEAVSISPQWEKAHWFERYTGKRI
jgi:ABC-type sugar transport system ATPase subunit